MSWSSDDEKFLLLLHKECNVLIGAYKKQYFEKNHQLCNYRIPTIILSSVSGFIAVSNAGYIDKEYEKYVSLLVGVINLITSTINVLEEFKRVSADMFLANKLYHELLQLSNDISLILSLPHNERQYKSGIEAISFFYERYSSIVKDANILRFEYENFLELKRVSSEVELKGKDDKDVIGIEI